MTERRDCDLSPEIGWRGKLAPFASYLWQQKGRLALAYSVSLLGVLTMLLLPWPLKFMIDSVLAGRAELPFLAGSSTSLQVVVLAAAIVVLATLAAIALGVDKMLHARVRERFGYLLRDDLVQRLFRLGRNRRQVERSGELTMRLVSDSQLVSRLMCKTIPIALKHALTALLTLTCILWINILLGLVALVMAALLGSIVMLYGPRLSGAASNKRHQEGRVAALTQETVTGIEHVQAMGLESRTRRRYLDEARLALHAGIEEVRIAVHLERMAQIVAGLALALVAGVGGLAVVNGQLSLGTLTVCLAYVTQLLKPIEKLNEIATTISRGMVRADRLYDLLMTNSSEAPIAGTGEPGRVRNIEFRNVYYRYPDDTADTISDLNYAFRRGQCTAIVGPSGCGKSTILRLLLQLQAPSGGRILVNGLDSQSLDGRALRQQFAVLLQDAHLFAGSVRDVLTEIDPGVSDKRLRRELQDVDLLALIDAMPQSLDTPLDEAGARISGGQRARLLLSRALVTDRPVLVLDEPFANIDTDSRRIILRRLEAAKRERIVIVVTHETALLSIADRVLRAKEFAPQERPVLSNKTNPYPVREPACADANG